jgi:hypothetical protein
LPSSTSRATDAAVIPFDSEAMANTVCSSTFSGLPASRTPIPVTATTRPSFTTAMAAPGTFQSASALRA